MWLINLIRLWYFKKTCIHDWTIKEKEIIKEEFIGTFMTTKREKIQYLMECRKCKIIKILSEDSGNE